LNFPCLELKHQDCREVEEHEDCASEEGAGGLGGIVRGFVRRVVRGVVMHWGEDCDEEGVDELAKSAGEKFHVCFWTT
jgi:hypothetical protein